MSHKDGCCACGTDTYTWNNSFSHARPRGLWSTHRPLAASSSSVINLSKCETVSLSNPRSFGAPFKKAPNPHKVYDTFSHNSAVSRVQAESQLQSPPHQQQQQSEAHNRDRISFLSPSGHPPIISCHYHQSFSPPQPHVPWLLRPPGAIFFGYQTIIWCHHLHHHCHHILQYFILILKL